MAEFPPLDQAEITSEELHALLQAGGDVSFRLVDCREDDEWQFNRIEGAILVPLSGFAAAAAKTFPVPEEKIVIYCHHGMRSGQAAHFLRHRGLKNVWSLRGGIDAWAQEIDPSVGSY